MVIKKTQKISAVIIAAGFSSRMHAFKPLLKLGDQTILERVITTFMQAGIKDIVVVLGYKQELLIPIVLKLNQKYVINESYTEGMFTSIQTGVRALDIDSQGFFMLPVDLPLVQVTTICQMVDFFLIRPLDVLHPTTAGRKGHPPLISHKLYQMILENTDSGGLKALLNLEQNNVGYLDVGDPWILEDMDTEEDYRRLERIFSQN